MEIDTFQNPRSFVVIEPDPVIAMDLAGILAHGFPENALTVFRDALAAEKHLLAMTSAVCVLINSRVASAGLLLALRNCVAQQGEVVFIGSMGDLDFPATAIQMPFTSKMILSILT